MENGIFDQLRHERIEEEDEDLVRDELNERPLTTNLDDSIELIEGEDAHEFAVSPTEQIRTFSARVRLSNKSMLKGLVERTENYNKTIDHKVISDARIAFEDEQLRGRNTASIDKGMEGLTVSDQITKRGRGDTFGRLRSSDERDHEQSTIFGSSKDVKPSANIKHIVSEEDSLSFQSPRRSTFTPPAKHKFDPTTAYCGRIVPDYRYSYNPQQALAHSAPTLVATNTQVPFVRPGQRYPKRPENNPQPAPKPKHLNHAYYEINLYGATQDERIAQRIEKTVRQTEAPARF